MSMTLKLTGEVWHDVGSISLGRLGNLFRSAEVLAKLVFFSFGIIFG